jgi:hypothetical protein
MQYFCILHPLDARYLVATNHRDNVFDFVKLAHLAPSTLVPWEWTKLATSKRESVARATNVSRGIADEVEFGKRCR